ncbi:hypothetical protein [Streptomyces sp. NPDC059460]|uniref:hypothetical protein n=1 Tax=Streptomyces sp. NPDC059460 TaxID=3346840 RepID=UPI0036B23FCC
MTQVPLQSGEALKEPSTNISRWIRAQGRLLRQSEQPSSRSIPEYALWAEMPQGSIVSEGDPVETVVSDDWVLDWVNKAREVPQRNGLVGLLAELTTYYPVRPHPAHRVDLPLRSAAAALGIPAAELHTCLRRLANAGLLTYSLWPDSERTLHGAITLIPVADSPVDFGI